MKWAIRGIRASSSDIDLWYRRRTHWLWTENCDKKFIAMIVMKMTRREIWWLACDKSCYCTPRSTNRSTCNKWRVLKQHMVRRLSLCFYYSLFRIRLEVFTLSKTSYTSIQILNYILRNFTYDQNALVDELDGLSAIVRTEVSLWAIFHKKETICVGQICFSFSLEC